MTKPTKSALKALEQQFSRSVKPLVAPDATKAVPPKVTPPTTAPGISGFVSGKGASAQKPTGKSGK